MDGIFRAATKLLNNNFYIKSESKVSRLREMNDKRTDKPCTRNAYAIHVSINITKKKQPRLFTKIIHNNQTLAIALLMGMELACVVYSIKGERHAINKYF